MSDGTDLKNTVRAAAKEISAAVKKNINAYVSELLKKGSEEGLKKGYEKFFKENKHRLNCIDDVSGLGDIEGWYEFLGECRTRIDAILKKEFRNYDTLEDEQKVIIRQPLLDALVSRLHKENISLREILSGNGRSDSSDNYITGAENIAKEFYNALCEYNEELASYLNNNLDLQNNLVAILSGGGGETVSVDKTAINMVVRKIATLNYALSDVGYRSIFDGYKTIVQAARFDGNGKEKSMSLLNKLHRRIEKGLPVTEAAESGSATRFGEGVAGIAAITGAVGVSSWASKVDKDIIEMEARGESTVFAKVKKTSLLVLSSILTMTGLYMGSKFFLNQMDR